MNTRTQLSAAIALALGGATAQALPLSDYDSAVVNVFVGGATATDNLLENTALAITGGWCVPGTIDIYRAENERVVFCRVNSTRVAGFPAAPGLKVAFHKESQGGSSNGVIPLIDIASGNAHALRWMDLNQLKTEGSCGAGVAVGVTTDLNAYTNHIANLTSTVAVDGCNTLLTPVDTNVSAAYDINWGIADHEPALSYPKPTVGDIAKLNSLPGVDIIFGVPVNQKLYRALQQAQGKPTDDLSTSIPSLTEEQIRGLYTGFLPTWNLFTNNAGTPITTLATDPPAVNDVYVCRRVASSGTQSSYESFWLGERCPGFDGATFVLPNDGSTIDDVTWDTIETPPDGTVNAAPSSGNVRQCFGAMETQDRWAIGTLSTEVTAANQTQGAIRMVAVSGYAPTLQNAANGSYPFFMTNSVNRVVDGQPGSLLATDSRRILIEYIETNIGKPALLSLLNSPFAGRPWGQGGAMAIPNFVTATPNVSPATAANMDTNPVNGNTRSPLGSTNNCSPPINFVSSPVPTITVTLP